MSITRRGFFGSLLGLFGCVVAKENKNSYANLRTIHPSAILKFETQKDDLNSSEIERIKQAFESQYKGSSHPDCVYLLPPRL